MALDLFGNQKIRTLGLYQPYATLMMHGKIETRWILKGCKPPFPLGKYLIYSTQKSYKLEEVQFISGDRYQAIRSICMRDDSSNLHGHALCIGDLYEVRDMGPLDEEMAFVKYNTDDDYRLVCLIFVNMKRIKPFPIKGKQGIGILTNTQKGWITYTEATDLPIQN